MTEGIRASNRSSVIAKRKGIPQLDGGNTSLASCDGSLNDDIPLMTYPPSPPTPVPPMMATPMPGPPVPVTPMPELSVTALPAPSPPMTTPPMTVLTTPPPRSKRHPAYPLKMTCRFCFEDSLTKNRQCGDFWRKKLTAAKRGLQFINLRT